MRPVRYMDLAFLRGFFVEFAKQGRWQVRFLDIRDSSTEGESMSRQFLWAFVLAVWTGRILVGQDLTSGVDRAWFDDSVRIQDDLFRHVNGIWLRQTPIPDDKSDYGSFTILMDQSQERIREIIEDAAANKHPAGSDAQKVGDFYRSFMDEAYVQQLGVTPVRSELEKLASLDDKQQLFRYWGYLQTIGVDGPIAFFVTLDSKDSTRYLATVVQSGISLPDRDYYLENDEKYLESRKALNAYVVRLYQLAEIDDGDAAAEAVLELETKIAQIQWERTELRDANKRYNKFAKADLLSTYSQIQWQPFLEEVDAATVAELNVMTPSFFEQFQQVFEQASLDEWKHYLRFHILDAAAPFLSNEFVEANFDFHQKKLAGVPEMKPRWKRAVEATAGTRGFGVLGDAVGRLYVAKFFTEDAKQRMSVLVANLLTAYQRSIQSLTWMTDETKTRALEKLSKINTKIGYTERWRDYSALEIDPRDLFGNVRRSNIVEHQRMIKKLGGPVDKSEWGMTPQTVNAYYNPGMNEIVFPAAILQPPFFDPAADDAVNYGGIGAVIGHEISHAFDDQGSQYDGDGNLKNWWTDRDRAAFHGLTERMVAQYNDYSPLPGKTVDGKLTLGENIADLSGLAIAFKAYQISLEEKLSRVLDGFTGEQRFFIGWAQVWRRKYRDAELLRRLLTDPHSPSLYRANGPIMNMDAFYDAFDVQPEDRLFKPKEERIQIW
ncbi:MAG: hypothetical protein KDA87_04710 [Planctomycetales bacterium]|nr:hypothetical protein [Planctomycetales bacterium]